MSQNKLQDAVYIGMTGSDPNSDRAVRKIDFLYGFERMQIPLRNKYGQPVNVFLWALGGHLCLGIEGHVERTSVEDYNSVLVVLDVHNLLACNAIIENPLGEEYAVRVFSGEPVVHIWSDKNQEDPTHEIPLGLAQADPRAEKKEK